MSSRENAPSQLQILPVVLSILHLPADISGLHMQSGIELSLPESETGPAIPFKAILSESTDRNLLLKSFYDTNIRGKVFDETTHVLFSLADLGISRCAFTSTFGKLQRQPLLDDKTAPQFKVDGVSPCSFMYQGYSFSPDFLICDHIFCRQEFETQFVAVLSLDLLRKFFIQARFDKKGWTIQLPPQPTSKIDELPVYTDGCCLSDGQAIEDHEAKPVRGGYGIHFPSLPSGWDMYSALARSGNPTNQKAELTAVIRALQLVRLRKVPCAKISIFTDSKYAVQGLNEWIPHLWRSNGYRAVENHVVVNADLFRSLDEEVSLSIKRGIPVTLSHVPKEQNWKADTLSKLGAGTRAPSIALNGAGTNTTGKPDKGGKKGAKAEAKGSGGPPDMMLGKDAIANMKPLVQWTPDGTIWHSLESGMEMLVV